MIASTSVAGRGCFNMVEFMSTLKIDSFNENEASASLGRYFRRKVVGYIERCHLEDGGYFFARVLPSSGMDTYFAVKSFSILRAKPSRPEETANYFLDQMNDGWLDDIVGLFVASEVLNELGLITVDFRHFAGQRIMSLQNKAGGFGTMENIDVEVPSELQKTYRAVTVLGILGVDFDRESIARFVSSLLNDDGGFGRNDFSTLASTFFAIEIHKLLGADMRRLTSTRGYLRDRETKWRAHFDNRQVNFLEDLFWLVRGLANLGEKSNFPDRVTRFVTACQRVNGGFSRATIMGIPTLEYTFYALSILREVRVL
jgi:hypothetical protein